MNRITLSILICICLTACTYEKEYRENAGDFVIEKVDVHKKRFFVPSEHLDTYYNIYTKDGKLDFDDLAEKYIRDLPFDDVIVMDVRPFLTMENGPLYCILTTDSDEPQYYFTVLKNNAGNEPVLIPFFSHNLLDDKNAWLYQIDSLFDNKVIFGSYILDEQTVTVRKQLTDLKYCRDKEIAEVHDPNKIDTVLTCDYLHGLYAISPDKNFIIRGADFHMLTGDATLDRFFITDLRSGETYDQAVSPGDRTLNYEYGQDSHQSWFARNFRLVLEGPDDNRTWRIHAIRSDSVSME